MVWVPPVASSLDEFGANVPSWLQHLPTAVINYRWAGSSQTSDYAASNHNAEPEGQSPAFLSWPTPIHDTLFGYSWITKNLSPPNYGRRDVYVCGSYLGASLAAALALTESHSHHAMAVRGLVAYNGIYNWTTFLPDHPLRRAKEQDPADMAYSPTDDQPGSVFHYLQHQVPALFQSPADLFDPFASACLFFHTAGLLVPPDFETSSASSAFLRAVDLLAQGGLDPAASGAEEPLKAPRRGYLAFPPRKSTLKIPPTLLLHQTPPRAARSDASAQRRLPGRRKKRPVVRENNFATQAESLATAMRRSIEKLEFKERMRWDDEFDDLDGGAERRVQVADVGPSAGVTEFGDRGQAAVKMWLEEKMGL